MASIGAILGSVGLVALGAIVAVGVVSPAMAEPPPSSGDTMSITVSQVGSNVEFSFSGNIDTGAFSVVNNGTISPRYQFNGQFLNAYIGGSVSGTSVDTYTPSDLSSLLGAFAGGDAEANAASGDIFGLNYNIFVGAAVDVPHNYTSGTQLAGTATFDSTTIADLGLNTGTFTQNYGSGDKIVLAIVASSSSPVIPEPDSLGLLAAGLGVVGLVRRRARRRSA